MGVSVLHSGLLDCYKNMAVVFIMGHFYGFVTVMGGMAGGVSITTGASIVCGCA